MPAYGNIYLALWEHTLFHKLIHRPALYYIYLDDIFWIWTQDMEKFQEFLHTANQHLSPLISNQPSVRTQWTFWTAWCSFHLSTSTTKFKSFSNPQTHSLLHKTSFHPKHTFKGLVKSQLNRFQRICSFLNTLKKLCKPSSKSYLLEAILKDNLSWSYLFTSLKWHILHYKSLHWSQHTGKT